MRSAESDSTNIYCWRDSIGLELYCRVDCVLRRLISRSLFVISSFKRVTSASRAASFCISFRSPQNASAGSPRAGRSIAINVVAIGTAALVLLSLASLSISGLNSQPQPPILQIGGTAPCSVNLTAPVHSVFPEWDFRANISAGSQLILDWQNAAPQSWTAGPLVAVRNPAFIRRCQPRYFSNVSVFHILVNAVWSIRFAAADPQAYAKPAAALSTLLMVSALLLYDTIRLLGAALLPFALLWFCARCASAWVRLAIRVNRLRLALFVAALLAGTLTPWRSQRDALRSIDLPRGSQWLPDGADACGFTHKAAVDALPFVGDVSVPQSALIKEQRVGQKPLLDEGSGTAVGRARRAIHAPVDSGCTGNLTWNRNWLVNIRPRLVGGKNRLGEPGWESPAHGSHRGQHGAREGGETVRPAEIYRIDQ